MRIEDTGINSSDHCPIVLKLLVPRLSIPVIPKLAQQHQNPQLCFRWDKADMPTGHVPRCVLLPHLHAGRLHWEKLWFPDGSPRMGHYRCWSAILLIIPPMCSPSFVLKSGQSSETIRSRTKCGLLYRLTERSYCLLIWQCLMAQLNFLSLCVVAIDIRNVWTLLCIWCIFNIKIWLIYTAILMALMPFWREIHDIILCK